MSRILFLSGWFPFPADNGSKLRISSLLKSLSHHHETTLLSFTDEVTSTDSAALSPFCRIAGLVPQTKYRPTALKALSGAVTPTPRSIVQTYNPEMARLVRDQLRSQAYDLVIASQITTAPYIARAARISKIWEEVQTSVEREAFLGARAGPARFRRWLTWAKTKRYVSRLALQFDLCTVVSALERQNLREVTPGYDNVAVVPNGIVLENYPLVDVEPEPGRLVFNGAMTYNANYDAMRYFVTQVWPAIRSAIPQARLLITGRTDGVAVGPLGSQDGVTLTGHIPDIRPTIRSAVACVAPLRIGGGTRLKILEAMALRTPVIATSKGAEGLEVTPEVDILIADTPPDLARQTIRLLSDSSLRQRLAANGRRLVERLYDWRAIGERFNELAESLAEPNKSWRFGT